jgi:predicted nucleotidyltransferase
MTDVRGALQRLQDAATDGVISEICQEFAVDLLVVFGSAVRGVRQPRDLDLAARFRPYNPGQVLIFWDRLAAIADSDALDLVVLNTGGPVIKERALLRPVVLFESRPGIWANAQIAAMMERMETARFRDEALSLASR